MSKEYVKIMTKKKKIKKKIYIQDIPKILKRTLYVYLLEVSKTCKLQKCSKYIRKYDFIKELIAFPLIF